ncbi:MAG TPA: cytochrome D1 domain-containing protein [Pyrinomonadaceae bacterium]|jgi:YVTN family beta-propeller protein|nr:cytochrome D1 domain-containing protein [Pyrinomonadaceae bacterium]
MRNIRQTLFSLALVTLALACAAFAQSALAQVAPAQEKAAAPAAAPQKPAVPQKIVTQGVEVEFTIEPVAAAAIDDGTAAQVMEEQDARVRFTVTDTTTHTPLTGIKPNVWLNRRVGDAAPKPEQCREKIQSFLQGSLRSRPDVDLNSFYLLTLNQEPNISVIDPLLGFGGSKLVTLVMLKSPGEDWAITSDQERLFVSMPDSNQVAVVDTNTWKVVTSIDTGARPVRLALQPDEKYLWVGTDEGAESGVTVIDTAAFKSVARVPTGAGHHEIALSGDNKFAYVTNGDAGTLSVVAVRNFSKVGEVKTGQRANAVAVSPLSKYAYVSDEAGGQVAVVDGPAAKLVSHIKADAGLGAVRFAPGGRYGFAPNPAGGVVYVFDASTNRVLHTLKIGKSPDQIAFTKEYAYVRSSGSLEVSMIRMSTVGKEPYVTKFPAGQVAPSEARTPAALADSIITAPDPNSVLIANVADQQIYYYTEGMAAPMGNLQNYKRDPRAVLVADRSLREIKSGTFETFTRLPTSGTYDVAFLLDSPRVTHCFETSAATNPSVEHERKVALGVEYLEREKPLRAGEPYKLRFRLTDTATGKPADGLKDVRVLVFLAPGIWQMRDFASEAGGGVYELNVNVPQPGYYTVFVESHSKGVQFRQMPYLTLEATGTQATTSAPVENE